MADPLVQLVDENDRPIGGGKKADIYQQALLHRIARVVLFDEDGLVLIQKRTTTKDLFPGCWDSSAAGHVDEGEDYLEAAERELFEEVGITAQLAEVSYYRSSSVDRNYKVDRFTKIYTATIPHSIQFRLQPQEVTEVKWISQDELVEFVDNNPDKITDGLSQIRQRLFGDRQPLASAEG